MRILLAVDESAASEAAVAEVVQRAWPAGSTARVLAVVDRFVPPAATLWYDAGGDIDEAREEVKEHFAELTAPIAARLRAVGLQVEEAIRDGDPTEVILAEARDWPADLIVMGSRGYSWLKRLLLGSVSQEVVEQSPCPVEIVHENEPDEDPS